MRKSFLLAALLLFITMGTALAGDNSMHIVTSGDGISVYAKSNTTKPIGTLYNGYYVGLSLTETNGRNSCWLTRDCTVWMDQDKAMALYPKDDHGYFSWKEFSEMKSAMPYHVFLAEVTADEAPLYTAPDHKHLTARHKKGTLLRICGEFGDDYFVDMNHIYGFIPKADTERYASLSFEEEYNWMEKRTLGVRQVYTDGPNLAIGFSATGYCDKRPVAVKNGDTVRVLRYLDGWAQLTNGAFIETRFLETDGDHSIRYATVKSSKALNRLNVRLDASEDSSVLVKLCSGTKVQVPSFTDTWAAVYITGTPGSEVYTGSAMMEFLEFGDAEGTNGCTRVRLTEWLYSGNGGTQYRSSWTGTPLPAGTELTVIGVEGEYNMNLDQGDRFLCMTDDGKVITIWDDGCILEPVENPKFTVRTNTNVRFREKPSREALSLRTLSSGTKVDVLLRGEGWTLVQYKDQIGYVMSRYLNFP